MPDTQVIGRGDVARATRKPRVIVADDHQLLRAGVLRTLESASHPGVDVVAEVANVGDLVVATHRLRPDALILDVGIAPGSVVDALPQLRASCPALAIVVLTTFDDTQTVRRALALGARAYLLKDAAAPHELLAALRAALRGATYLAPGIETRLLSAGGVGSGAMLTERELAVVRLWVLGHTYPEIAQQLRWSERTVKGDRERACDKLGVRRRAELVAWAHGSGLVAPRRPRTAASRAC